MAGIGEPAIEELGERVLAGLSYFGDPFQSHAGWTEENEIGRLWKRFGTYLATEPAWLASARRDVRYELQVVHPETFVSGEFEVFAGLELVDEAGAAPLSPGSPLAVSVPVEVSVKRVPPGRYARFTVPGTEVATDMQMAISKWLGENGYRRDIPFDLLAYDERFKGMDNLDESTVDVYVPLAQG